MKEEISPRERVMTALRHEETDRVPFNLGMGINYPVKKELRKYLNMDSMDELNNYLKSLKDIRSTGPAYVGPEDLNITLEDGSRIDYWGVKREPVSYGSGSYNEISYYPLGEAEDIKDLDDHLWPSVDWWDTSDFKEKVKRASENKKYAIQIGNGNIFETSWYMRGLEKMLMDLVVNPDLAWNIMERVTDYYIAYFRKVLEAADGLIDLVFTADDLGSQEGLMFSLDMWEKMIKPHHKRLNKVLKEYGVKIIYHSDGAVMDVIPGLIDMGIDILEAIQFDAKGMDPITLKKEYGNKLCFHGGVSVQSTLPHGSVEEVKEEVKERIDVLGKNGGYILAPSHAVQAGTPPENVMAFIETGLNYYFD